MKAGFLKISGIEQTIHDQRTASKNKNEPTYTERMLGADTAPLIKQYGGCIEAFTASKGFRVADELIKAGQALKDDKLNENEQVDKLKNVAVVIDRVITNLRTTGNDNEKQEKEKFEPSLQLLKKMNAGPQSETPQVKEQLKIGGRMVGFIGRAPVMHAFVMTRVDSDRYIETKLFETDVEYLINANIQQFSL